MRAFSALSGRLRRYVEDDGGRSLVQESLDELRKGVWILKPRPRIEAGDPEELPIALHPPVYPPRPHFLTLPPAPNLDSRQRDPFSRLFKREYRHEHEVVNVPQRGPVSARSHALPS